MKKHKYIRIIKIRVALYYSRYYLEMHHILLHETNSYIMEHVTTSIFMRFWVLQFEKDVSCLWCMILHWSDISTYFDACFHQGCTKRGNGYEFPKREAIRNATSPNFGNGETRIYIYIERKYLNIYVCVYLNIYVCVCVCARAIIKHKWYIIIHYT